MKFKKILLGSIFLICSGIMYQTDKVLNYYKWASFIIAGNRQGGYPAKPDETSLFDNEIAFLFFIIGILFYIHVGLSLYKKKP